MSRTRPLPKPAPTPDRPERVRAVDVPRLSLGEANAAAAVDLPRSTFRDVVRKYGIPFVEVGNGTKKRRRLYLVEDLIAWLREHRNGGAA